MTVHDVPTLSTQRWSLPSATSIGVVILNLLKILLFHKWGSKIQSIFLDAVFNYNIFKGPLFKNELLAQCRQQV